VPAYEIHFLCDDCKREHAIHLRIHLEDGPARKETFAAFLRRSLMPPQITNIRGRKAFCLKTGKRFTLDNDDQIFLVPFTDNRPVQLIPEDDP